MKPSQVLIIGGSPTTGKDIQGLLSSSSIRSTAVASWAEASRLLRRRRFYAVVVDLDDMPTEGPKFLAALQREAPNTTVILITQAPDNALLAEWGALGPSMS